MMPFGVKHAWQWEIPEGHVGLEEHHRTKWENFGRVYIEDLMGIY
jgi:hypothetical protein